LINNLLVFCKIYFNFIYLMRIIQKLNVMSLTVARSECVRGVLTHANLT